MAKLDRFIDVMREQRADALQLATGRPVALLVPGGAARAVTRDALTAPQVLALVREIAPPGHAEALGGERAAEWSYGTPSGPVRVLVAPGDAGPVVTIRAEPQGPPARPVEELRGEMEGLFRRLVESGASDLHLRAGQPPVLRIQGDLRREPQPPLRPDHLEALLGSIMGAREAGEYRETGDADWAYEVPGLARFRCNAGRDRHGPIAVFRVIASRIPAAEELGLSREVQALCQLTKGLVLVTGPTGSGKSTTLAAMVDLVNRTRTDHILTIEDPIEFVHESKQSLVTQRQVGLHTRGFKQALRAALREDPDVVLVGEMRDLETVSIAIETAETGHLVFGTLHTTTAAGTIDRIIDQFPSDRQSQIRVMLSESLRGVISQTLCRKVGGGRVAAREILLSIPAISNLIREGKTFQIPSIMQTNRKAGMITLNDALLELVEQKVIEPREAYTRAVEKPALVASLRAKRIDTSFVGEA